MTDAQTRQRVQQIVLQLIGQSAMFTAYDVTVEARKQGLQLRHDEGRDIVHEMFQTGVMGASYNRSVIDVGAPTKPFLYHRFDSDPSTYRSPVAGGTPTTPAAPQTGLVGRLLQKFFGTPSPAHQPPSARPISNQPTTPNSPVQPSSGRMRQRDAVTLNLDASAFLPISRDDLVNQAKGLSRMWGSPWFGRRDLIPPADDARTSLIDRGMLTQGILSAQDLADIHHVGAEMDRFRPAQVLIRSESHKAGQAAVEADREKRIEEKAKKKAEAAERKAKRAQEIQHARATDILFLGRRVSGQLNDRQSDIERLQQATLPVLSTPADVAQALGISIPKLRWLSFHTQVATRTHYVSFVVPKKSGGLRTLSAPHRSLANAQQWILRNILDQLSCEGAAHGFVKGHSILSNAVPHVGKAVVLNMDLENFFPGISFARVRRMFNKLGYSPAVATILALLCTECPRRAVVFNGQTYLVATGPRGLPQGASTSPAISNQIVRRLDRRLQGLANRIGFTYTRYADDITCSGNEELRCRVGYVMACVRHVAQDEGFSVNEGKSRVLRRNTAQVVTGLVVNDRPTVSRERLRTLRAILHRAKFEGLAAQNRDRHPNFRAWLEGSIAFVSMTRPELGAAMRGQLSGLRD